MNALPGIRVAETDVAAIGPPASRVPAAIARKSLVQRELAALKIGRAACVLACAENAPGADGELDLLRAQLAAAEFELSGSDLAIDLARHLDDVGLAAWKAAVQDLPPEQIIEGIAIDGCALRCRPGACVIAGSDAMPSECLHPVRTGPLNSIRHQANPKILAVYAAAVEEIRKMKAGR
jgi:hypothetical protein